MEGHFSVVWCNFGAKDEFNRKNLTDIKNFRASAKKVIFRKFRRYFAEIVNLAFNSPISRLIQTALLKISSY
jgi:hypothetical protein